MNIKTWNNYEKLLNLTTFLIALRREDNIKNLNENFPFDYKIIDGEKLDLSSTSIREKLENSIFDANDIPLKIISYIKANNIY